MIAPAYAVAAAALLVTAGVSGGLGLLLGYTAARARIAALTATNRRLRSERDTARACPAHTGCDCPEGDR